MRNALAIPPFQDTVGIVAMFGLFKSTLANFVSPEKAPFSGRTGPETAIGQAQMTLQERMEVRREMAFSSVREHFLHLGVLPSTYTMKIVPSDERHHRFIIIVDAKRKFETQAAETRATFDDAEQYIADQTFAKYGVRIDGIYWRVAQSGRRAPTDGRARNMTSPVNPVVNGRPVNVRNATVPVPDNEMAAYQAAIARRQPPPAIHVGTKEYRSEMAPLEFPPQSFPDTEILE